MGAGRRAIDIQSFRATYGWLGINITGRLLEHATKLPDSLVAENVDLPVGDNRVTVAIANTRARRLRRHLIHNRLGPPRMGLTARIHRADR